MQFDTSHVSLGQLITKLETSMTESLDDHDDKTGQLA